MLLLFFLMVALKDHQFGKKLFIRLTVRVFRECLSFCVCASFPFGFEGDCNRGIYMYFVRF